MKRALVWDIPTRLFHWCFAASFAIAWLTSDSDQWLSIHIFCGYLMLGLIGFRLAWGFIGGRYARFSSFWYGPKAGLAYLRTVVSATAKRHVGHNPTGSVAIFLLLGLGLLVGITGIFTQGSEEQHGVVRGLVSIATGRLFKEGHEIAATLMLLLVVVHLAGVAVESWLHKENLPRSMINGVKAVPEHTQGSLSFGPVGLLMLIVIAAFAAWWFAYALPDPAARWLGYEKATGQTPNIAFIGLRLADDPLWRDECGSCHIAFHPNLLPTRSWRKIMAEQRTHFGADLALDDEITNSVREFLLKNAAEVSRTEAAFKILSSLSPEVTPLRITETPYWLRKHKEITAADWALPLVKSKINCGGCHLDADAGTFEDAAMRIPR
jgi:cytochrome b